MRRVSSAQAFKYALRRCHSTTRGNMQSSEQAMGSSYHFVLLSVALLMISVAILIRKTLTAQRSRRRLPPSPFAIPIIGHLHLLPPIPHQSLHWLSLRLGPIFHLRLGSVPCIVVSSPDIAREVLRTQETSFLDRPLTETVSFLTYHSDFIFSPYGPYWRFMRRISMDRLLSPKTLDRLGPLRHDEMSRFVEGLREKSRLGVGVRVGEELIKLTNNEISLVAVGRRCSGTERGAEEARGIIREVAELVGTFKLGDYIGVFKCFDFQGIGKRARDVHARYDRMIEGIMKEKEGRRKDEGSEEDERVKDLLDMMLDMTEDESSEIKLTREHIKAYILDLFQGGSETSALAIEWGLSELINHPASLQKARSEIDAVVGKALIVCEADIPDLPYLQSIVKETLRLHPTGPLIVRRSTRDCEIAGYHIPSNAHVLVNAWSIGRDPEQWEDPLEFLPERFVDGGVDVKGHHFQLLPFGSGRRGCPGMPLALHTMAVTLGIMVQCFEWRVEGGDGQPAVVDMSEGVGLTLPKAKPLVCTLVARLDPMPLA